MKIGDKSRASDANGGFCKSASLDEILKHGHISGT